MANRIRGRVTRRGVLIALLGAGVTACGGGGSPSPASPSPASPSASPTPPGTPTFTTTPTATATATQAATRTPTPTATATPVPPTATPTRVPELPRDRPLGFPIDPGTRTGIVEGRVGSRVIRWGGGPDALSYSRDDQPSDDPERANRCGWNARVHLEYEGQPAVDWYVPVGTPVLATMDGTATLAAISTTNAFDAYGTDREPYIGDPDRSRAPLSPFPGPGGGQGVLVRVDSGAFVTSNGHLDLSATFAAVPASAWLPGVAPGENLVRRFAPLRGFQDETVLARWPVRRGDVIGFTGDSGYSEAPHLHYTVRRAGGPLLCPTTESGFSDGGWLFRGE